MNFPVHDETFTMALLFFLFLKIGTITLFISTTELKFVYEMSRISLTLASIYYPTLLIPALFIKTPISILLLSYSNSLQMLWTSFSLLKSPITIYNWASGNFYTKILTFLSIFYLFRPIKTSFILNLNKSWTKDHPIP